MNVLRAPNGQRVTHVSEVVTIAFPVTGANDDGSPIYQAGAEGVIDWDSQRPEMRGGQFVYLTPDGKSWTRDQLTSVPCEDASADGE